MLQYNLTLQRNRCGRQSLTQLGRVRQSDRWSTETASRASFQGPAARQGRDRRAQADTLGTRSHRRQRHPWIVGWGSGHAAVDVVVVDGVVLVEHAVPPRSIGQSGELGEGLGIAALSRGRELDTVKQTRTSYKSLALLLYGRVPRSTTLRSDEGGSKLCVSTLVLNLLKHRSLG